MEFMRRAIFSIFGKRLEDSEEASSIFLKSGSKLLEEFVAKWGGRNGIQLRNFSAKELANATDNFDFRGLVHEDSYYKTYRGSFERRQVLVKRYVSSSGWGPYLETFFVRDICISSQMSFHKNVLKLVGYCLYFEYPALVYRSPEAYDRLSRQLFHTKGLKLTWKNRLGIASDIANVLAYLHTGFRTPIIHRNLNLRQVVMDKNCVAQFADFAFCISIPQGECQVEDDVISTNSYLDPKYAVTGVLTEKTDVYNIGVVLFELLTRVKHAYVEYGNNFSSLSDFLRSYIEGDDVEDIVIRNMVMEGETGQHQEFRAFAALALKCIAEDRDSRPEMVDVAKELRRIQQSPSSSSTS